MHAATQALDRDPATRPSDGRIVARGLTRAFGPRIALHPIDLDLGPGGITGLLGPNGSGKSTLLRLLTGLVRPDAGSASVDGVALRGDGTAIRLRATYAPGEIGVYGELSAREHLAWMLRGRDARAPARALEIAAQLGLPLDQRVRTFSHGMKRQLLFAAALAPAVRVRILDEATEGLDPSKRAAVLDLLQEDAARGTTIVLSSHHLGEVDRVCDRLVFLNDGHKLAEETAAGLAARARRFVRATFPAGTNMARVAADVARLDHARVTVDGERLDVELDGDDPRPFLAAVCTSASIPQPRSIAFGELSLAELYRELYGVRGC